MRCVLPVNPSWFMTTSFPCRLLIHDPAPGAWNMAVDEVLLNGTEEQHAATLRFYQWQKPTLSLGYFQKYEERSEHTASKDEDIVRRLSGGGAIVHDQEVTYSLILPPKHPLVDDTQGLYDAIHEKLVEYLQAKISVVTEKWLVSLCPESSAISQRDQPFLCFQRRAKGDILMSSKNSEDRCDFQNHKIVGSAQRRRRGVVLQHGSILLSQSLAAPELPGIQQLTDLKLDPNNLIADLPELIADSLRLNLQRWQLPIDLNQQSKRLANEKYLSSSWTRRR